MKVLATCSLLALLASACMISEDDPAIEPVQPEAAALTAAPQLSDAELSAGAAALTAPITVDGYCEDQLAFCEGRCIMGPPAFRAPCFQRCGVGYSDCLGH